ncbi:MAG: PP2C family protein-serine/threonine phosphatase, partial [Streptomyces sp.]|uniref:PP2C family protein-serine/threonine phosphatase n=1 Tax=Streptomyces sp. TaxID=1931 RepID=UPI003D6C469B
GVGRAPLTGRVGSAEWNLLTDEVSWSEELYGIFGRPPEEGPLSLDELPSWVLPEDQPLLASAVTDCLVDGRPIDQEFRIMRPDRAVRSLHLMGEPVLDDHGGTTAMWTVLRDVSELRRSELTVRETGETARQERHVARTEHRVAVELQESVLPPWRGAQRVPHAGSHAEGALDLASHYLPSATSALIGGDWYDALELPDGATLLSAGDLTGHGVAATSGMAMLLGAVRGMAVAGVEPGALMGHLNQLLDSAAQPALGSAVCCRYEPRDRTLTWAQAGHPAPLLFRAGAGRILCPPQGVLLGATSGAAYGQRTELLQPGDLLVLHTDGLVPPGTPPAAAADEPHAGTERLLALGARFAATRTAQECVRVVVEEFGGREREDDACVLIARVHA